jgi:hypothetical protein
MVRLPLSLGSLIWIGDGGGVVVVIKDRGWSDGVGKSSGGGADDLGTA